MSVPNNILLLDVGNTCIKYALVDSTGKKHFGVIQKADDLLAMLATVKTCYISAVGQKIKVKEIQTVLTDNNIESYHIASQAAFAGLTCAYQKINKLGVDRWLAMLACRKQYAGNFAVLDFGTAMTCDVVNATGQHLGGWIAPMF
ncbi:type III pantothenate kinase [Paraglaciecola aquimarina]|uniref:Type III pantothenate kinase n=1 Tax=Paraglaciecola aquimarina TaxID=1235557 RepID=A0ABU3SSU8_9ALTE|nr:type III pantothenate kinase [Paraglaciecola aquimarina]MDU0353076.1 type III pantothenate kinase [Paraglaciecola aquimarina]